MEQIRNFVIISHVDHGKSTLADRFLELTGTVEPRKMREQYLDRMELEREKGITIKMAPVRMIWRQSANSKAQSARQNDLRFALRDLRDSGFILNLIDTPGHADFSYEVSRALAAVEGAILLVDATQGVQAQTVANLHLAQKENLAIIPVINKIDLPSAEFRKTAKEMSLLLGVAEEEILAVSAKTGQGVEGLLAAVIERIPPPQSDISKFRNIDMSSASLRALIFDSVYDPHQGVVVHVRVFGGSVKKGERIRFLASGAEAEIADAGIFSPERRPQDGLASGEIGYIATGIKEPEKVRVGDTITRNIDISKYLVEPLAGYREPEPMVFASVFPENQDDYEILRESLKKLKLNDASLYFESEDASAALGRGFRAGFLGLLHMEIVAERLRREYGLKLVFSNPSVAFRVQARTNADLARTNAEGPRGSAKIIFSAAKMPLARELQTIEEPWVRAEIIAPSGFIGAVSALIHERSGRVSETASVGAERLQIKFEAPLREIIVDFYDKLKSVTHGFASMAYELADYRRSDLVRLDILVTGERMPPLAEIVPREKVYHIARQRLLKLKELLPRELFSVALQAEAEGRIIARETIPALRKDVTGYLYGGDRTRKMKLWAKQKRGKERLVKTGRVEIPAEVYRQMLKR